MILLLAIFVALTIAIAAFVLAPHLRGAHPIVFDEAPDLPLPFGPDMCWLAIKTRNTMDVVEALNLADTRPANWNAGIGAIYDAETSDCYVFVSPSVKGWTFVAGLPLPLPAGPSFVEKLSPLVASLARKYPEVHYFAALPIIDFFAWMRVDKGRVVRAFAIGEAGTVWNRGKLTVDEKALGLSLFEVRGIEGQEGDVGGAILLHPTERHVLRLAGRWGISPLDLGKYAAQSGIGIVGQAPAAWRAERIRKAA